MGFFPAQSPKSTEKIYLNWGLKYICITMYIVRTNECTDRMYIYIVLVARREIYVGDCKVAQQRTKISSL
jgi:hypothetical protein